MPTAPVHHGCSAIQASSSSASSCSWSEYSSVSTPSGVAAAADVHPQRGVAVRREPGVVERVVGGRHVVLAVRQVLEDRGDRVRLGVLRQPHARAEAGAVRERDPDRVGDPDRGGHSPPAAACHDGPEPAVIVPSPSTATALTRLKASDPGLVSCTTSSCPISARRARTCGSTQRVHVGRPSLRVHPRLVDRVLHAEPVVDDADRGVQHAGEDRVAAGAGHGEHAAAVARRHDRRHREERHLARRDRVRVSGAGVEVHHRVVQHDPRAGHHDQRPEVRRRSW